MASLAGQTQTKQIGEHGHSLTHQQGICIRTLRVPHLHRTWPLPPGCPGWCFSHQCAPHKPGNPQLCSQSVQALSHPPVGWHQLQQTQGWQSETLGPAPPPDGWHPFQEHMLCSQGHQDWAAPNSERSNPRSTVALQPAISGPAPHPLAGQQQTWDPIGAGFPDEGGDLNRTP